MFLPKYPLPPPQSRKNGAPKMENPPPRPRAGITEIYKAGTLVTIKINKMPAVINSVKIEMNNIIYKASYFSGDEFRQVDLWEYEFDVVENPQKQIIGFKK